MFISIGQVSKLADFQLIFEGEIEDFIATDHLKNEMVVDKTDTIGIDLNRRGEFAVVSNLDVDMHKDIAKQSQRWDGILEKIGHLQHLDSKTNNAWKSKIYQFQIDDLYIRKHNIPRITI